MKPKRRYTSPEQIVVEMEQAKEKAALLAQSADALDKLAVELKRLYRIESNYFYFEQAVDEQKKAEKLRTTANNLLNLKIRELSRKLAEIQTIPLNGFLPDDSVEA